MNEGLQSKILELIGSADEFALETAPKAIADVLLWAQVRWMIPGSLLVLVLVVVIPLLLKAHKWKREGDLNSNDFFGLVILCMFPVMLFLVPTLVLLMTALQATVSPYSYLIETIAPYSSLMGWVK